MHTSLTSIGRHLSMISMCILLSSCSGTKTAQSSSMNPSVFVKTATDTSTPSKTSTSTYTPTSSRTLIPSATATLSGKEIQATETEQTIKAYETKIAEYPFQCNDSIGETSISPSGSWLAVCCGYKRNQNLEIINQKGNRWTLYFKNYLLEEFLAPNGESDVMGNLYPAHWTNDERYLFFSVYIGFDGGGGCFYGGFGVQGLFRLDLATGNVSTILPATSGGYYIAFSPKGRWLAYEIHGDPIILDLNNGEKISISEKDNFAGNFTWSPDGTELAYGTCEINFDFGVKKTAINIFNLKTRSSRTVIELENNFLTIVGWDDDNVIKIEDEDFQANDSNNLYFNVRTSKFVTATPTP